jgi:imidazolonepropionase
MSSTVVTGISELVTNDPAVGDGSILGLISNAAVVVEDGQIAWVGSGMTAPAADRRIQLGGRAVIPGFVDSHTHLAFAGDRVTEFVARMDGNAYDGGGIDQTVRDTRATSVDDLRALLAGRMSELRTQGTTTVEIKSGYGLDTSTEVRLLRLAGEFSQEVTFLGAHLVPAGVSAEEYVDVASVRATRPMDRRVLRAVAPPRLRRRHGAHYPSRWQSGGPSATSPRQPIV